MSPTTEQEKVPLWRNCDYLILITGQTISGAGSAMSYFVLPLIAVEITGSATQAGLVAAAGGVGQLLAMLPAGVTVDRHDRRHVMQVSAGIGATLYGSLVIAYFISGTWSVAHLLLVAFATGVASSLFAPAETASLPFVVQPDQLPTAIATNQGRQAVTQLSGPPLGGILLAIGRSIPFLADAVSYALSSLLLWFIRIPLTEPDEDATVRVKGKLFPEIRNGLRFIWSDAFLRTVAVASTILDFSANGVFIVLNLHLLRDGIAPARIGLLGTITGSAALAGAFLSSWMLKHFRPGSLAIAVFWLWTLAIASLPLLSSLIAIGAVLALAMSLNPAANSALISYRIAITPNHLQGRATSAMNLLEKAAIPLGAPIGGYLLDALGYKAAIGLFVLVMACGTVLISLSRAVKAIPMTSEWTSQVTTEHAKHGQPQ